MLYVKIDILAAMKERGVTQYRIRKDGLLGVKTIMDLRAGKVPGIKVIDTICRILECQPGDIIGYKSDEEGKLADVGNRSSEKSNCEI